MYTNRPPADDEDDATRIYRPYGSPPPDPTEADPATLAPATLPPVSPRADAPPAGDPFRAPEPFVADPFAPGVLAPEPFAPPPAVPDPFAPAWPPAASAAPDPFTPRSFAPEPFAPDPFAPPSQGLAPSDPFAFAPSDPFPPAPLPPIPPASFQWPDPGVQAAPPDPFAPVARAPEHPPAPDPFLPPPVPLPLAAPPLAAPPLAAPSPAPPSPDPFRPTDRDPFYGAAPSTSTAPSPDPFRAAARDPFQTPARDPFAPATPDPFDLGPRRAAPPPRAVAPVAGVAAGGEGRISDAFASVFALVLQLRASSDFGDPVALRQRAEALLDRAVAAARATGAEVADVREAEFCLVAFLDEAVLTSEWPGRDGWAAHPLQLSRYERYDAGEAFFDRLRLLLTEGGRDEVLEVYYLCIALGYKGRYQIHGREVLGQLVEDLKGRLARAPGGAPRAIAPHALPRSPVAVATAGGIPTWVLFAGAALLVVLLYVGLSVSVSGIARGVASDVRALSAATP